MHRSTSRGAAAGLLALAMLGGAAGGAHAKDDDDHEAGTSGRCSAGTEWKLEAKSDDGRLEVEFELDSNRTGQRWSVRIRDNGVRVFAGTRTTKAPSGSFGVERRIVDRAGTDRIAVSATNVKTGEHCRGAVTF